MRTMIRHIPIPTAGVALGVAALGNLLAPSAESIHAACGIISFILWLSVTARMIFAPKLTLEDFQNPLIASVSGTWAMTLMQLCTYAAPFAFELARIAWIFAVLCHVVIIAWFCIRFVPRKRLEDIFPTAYICFVGIAVASVTCPVFNFYDVGIAAWAFGIITFIALLALVTLRIKKYPLGEAALPLLCIYAAPTSLLIAATYAVFPEAPTAAMIPTLLLAQVLLFGVIRILPRLLALPFYPSYSAMTFPFVISATSFGLVINHADIPVAFQGVLHALGGLETILATVMVSYVLVRYTMFFFDTWKTCHQEVSETNAAQQVA